ncbi:taste receptor type 2 member 40-like [Pelodytes ibericus]
MSRVLDVILMALDIGVILPSILMNMFIIIRTIILWKKCKRTDQLVFGITAANLVHGLLKANRNGFLILGPHYFKGHVYKVNSVVMFIVMSCSLWISTWLCVHFCLKIVNINLKCYIYLQKTFSKKLPWIFPLSLFGSILISLPFVWDIVDHIKHDVNCSSSYEGQVLKFVMKKNKNYANHIYITGCSVAFLLFLIPAVNIIISLFKHMKHMQDNAEGFRSPNVAAHIRACKTLASLLMMDVGFFTALLIVNFKGGDSYWLPICSISNSLLHNLSSLTLIKVNCKLNKTLDEMLTCCSFPKTS